MDALMSASRDGFCYQDQFTILGGGSVESGGFNTHICGLAKGYASKSTSFAFHIKEKNAFIILCPQP